MYYWHKVMNTNLLEKPLHYVAYTGMTSSKDHSLPDLNKIASTLRRGSIWIREYIVEFYQDLGKKVCLGKQELATHKSVSALFDDKCPMYTLGTLLHICPC